MNFRAEEKRERLRRHALALLGTQGDRSDGKASFEKWPQAVRIRTGDRAYPFGCLVQQPNLVEAPAAAFKLPEEEHLEDLEQHRSEIKEFLEVGSKSSPIGVPDNNCT